MSRILSALFLFLASFAAFAQRAADEAPVEKASPVTVLIFLALFLGGCLAYVVYVWVRRKKDTNPVEK